MPELAARSGEKRAAEEANENYHHTGRNERHIIPFKAAGLASHQDRLQQRPQGHHGWKDAGFSQDKEAARNGNRQGRCGNGYAHRGSWWHPYLCRRRWHYRKQPRPWHLRAKGQRTKASALEAEYRIPGQMLHSSRARSPRQSPKRSMTCHDVFVLIPQKARLIGVYDSRVAFGQSRGPARVRDRLSRRQDPWPRRVE
jgi:hypothetical protein